MKNYNIAIVGASGLVGRTMVKVLEERNFRVDNLKLLASEKSAGQHISFRGKEYHVEELTKDSFQGVDIALFSAGGACSKEFAPIAAKAGCIVIDNSSAWRLDNDIPLVVPEVNPEDLREHKNIIANPNCSTIQMLAAIKPIVDKYGLERLVCSTYQSISGAGQKGVDKLIGEITDPHFSEGRHRIAFNTMFHTAKADGFTDEEYKMIHETRKMLHMPELRLAMTCVRLPLLGGHGESLNLELKNEYQMEDIHTLIEETEGLVLMDDIENEEYPTPLAAQNRDEVFIGRLRRDDSCQNGLYMWVVADNLRKGAATNAVQIAEKMIEMELV
jgi:aspartate-semialdehyde dehydrogenase